MKKKSILIMALLTILNLSLSLNLKSQVAVNTTGEAPNASSMLDVSSTDKGILIPRMTKAERDLIDSPETGLLIYQTDNTLGFYFYNGTGWVVVGDGATSINSLYDGITDSYSLFLGEGAGASDDGSDNRNTVVGINAYNSSVNGYANTAFGNEALKLNTAGTHNAVFGTQALTSNLTGIENTVIGTNAGFNVTGSGNILIGFNAAFSETDISNKLFIDNSSTGTPLIFGDFSTNLLRINGTLDINNAYQLPTSDGTSGQTLKTDGSGSLTWSDDTNTGATSIDELSDAATDNNSLFLGIDAGANDDGTTNFNTGTGVWSLKEVAEGSHNSAFGTTALQQLTTGNQNTAFGMGALNSVTTNSNNTAIGKEAGKDVTGTGNIFIGNEAAKSQTSISNKLYIDNSDTVAPLIYGEFETNTVRVNHKLELTSDSTGSSLKLYEPDTAGVHYTMFKTQPQDTNIVYYLPGLAGSTGQVLKYNSVGKLGWSDDNGATDINGLSDGKTGGYSVFLGQNAGNADDGNDNGNIGIGYNALLRNSTGTYNTGIGSSALYSNLTGTSNTGIGYSALFKNSTGTYNTGIGYGALGSNTTGNYNIAIGKWALGYNETGGNNVAIGHEAGDNSYYTNKTACVFIGYQAGYNTSTSNRLYIENSSSSSPLIYGEFDNDLVRINGDLEVTGSLAGMDIDDLSDAKTDGSSVFLGLNAGINDDGDNFNTSVGINALTTNTSGQSNTAFGESSLKLNTSGDNLTAMGVNALNANTTGNWNCAFGKEALYYSTTASENTAMGGQALSNNTTGHHNVAIGRSSMTNNTTGSENTAVGADTRTDAVDRGNAGAFGYNTVATASDYFRIGNSSVSSIGGQVGWSTYSDGRFKRNVNENVPGLEFILKLKPVSYNWDIHKLDDFIGATEGTEKSEHMREARRQQEARTYTGFVAQDVEKAAKEIGYDFSGVETPPNDGTPYSIRYAEFVVPLVKAVQEQQEMIELLKQKNEMLIKRIEKLEEK